MARDHTAVTARLVAELESGVAPWVRPWSTVGTSDLPHNAATARVYHGANVLALWMAQAASGYPTAEWLTFQQARERNAWVRKGEHGTAIFYVNRVARTATDANGDEVTRHIPFLRAFTVFNVAQVDGLAERAQAAPRTQEARLEGVDSFLRAIGADVTLGGDRACYVPGLDAIWLPQVERFDSVAAFYGTALHEHAHWTGAPHRLARSFGKRFGDDAYAVEELVAELTSAFLCAELGIPGRLQHAEYLAHWATVLKADPQVLWTAGARASESVAYLSRCAGRDVEEAA